VTSGWDALLLAAAAFVLTLPASAGWRIAWLVTRLRRAHHRTERAWAGLDAALVRRADRAIEMAGDTRLEPAAALRLLDAAERALAAGPARAEREAAESWLSHVLGAADLPGISREHRRVMLARRLHNDAVLTTRWLHRHRWVRTFRLVRNAHEPASFEFADVDRCALAGEQARRPTSLAPVLGGTRGIR